MSSSVIVNSDNHIIDNCWPTTIGKLDCNQVGFELVTTASVDREDSLLLSGYIFSNLQLNLRLVAPEPIADKVFISNGGTINAKIHQFIQSLPYTIPPTVIVTYRVVFTRTSANTFKACCTIALDGGIIISITEDCNQNFTDFVNSDNTGKISLDGSTGHYRGSLQCMVTWINYKDNTYWYRKHVFDDDMPEYCDINDMVFVDTDPDLELPPIITEPLHYEGQTYLALYKDYACTNKFSEHYSDGRDTNPVTPEHQLIVPYGGAMESSVFPTFLKSKPGYTVVCPIGMYVRDDIIRNDVPTKNRWIIGTESELYYSTWGSAIYLMDAIISDEPTPIYVKARTLGPPGVRFTVDQDAVCPDWNVHFLIEAVIKRG